MAPPGEDGSVSRSNGSWSQTIWGNSVTRSYTARRLRPVRQLAACQHHFADESESRHCRQKDYWCCIVGRLDDASHLTQMQQLRRCPRHVQVLQRVGTKQWERDADLGVDGVGHREVLAGADT